MDVHAASLQGTGSCCGSFGELLQGAAPQIGPFLVTLPIDLHARARFAIGPYNDGLVVNPGHKWKAQRLTALLLARHGLPVQGRLHISSDIPAGKGLAGSTADLVASYRAVTACHRLQHSIPELQALLRRIEPSNGVMHDGIVAYLHREVAMHEHIAATPALTLIAVDEGGQVDTLEFNAHAPAFSAQQQAEYARLYARLRTAFRLGDIAGVGVVSTRSAELHQQLHPRRYFTQMREMAAQAGAAGVVVTHSGPCLAIMLDANDPRHDQKLATLTAALTASGHEPRLYKSLRADSSSTDVCIGAGSG